MQNLQQKYSSIVLAAFLTSIGSSQLYAEEVDKKNEKEENTIVITSLKRSKTLQETPISVSAIGEDELLRIGADDFEDYVNKVPGLTLLDQGPGARRLVIRGVQGPGEAQVGLYFDETPLTGAPGASTDAGQRQPDIKMFDIERVEVLRGPQGTLYGAGTMGGTLRIISNKPDASLMEAKISADIFSTDNADLSSQLNVMANVPLIDDELAIRLVGYNRDVAGYIDNISYGEKGVNSEKSTGGRASMRWTPNEDFTLTGSYIFQDSEIGSGSHYTLGLNDLESSTRTRDGFDDEVDIFSFTMENDFDFANLLISYSKYERDVIFRFDADLIPTLPLAVIQPQPLDMTSFEARLSTDNDDAINWTFGFFTSTRDAKLGSSVFVGGEDGEATDTQLFKREDETSLTQRSIFGEVYYDVSESLELTVGARLFESEFSKKDIVFQAFGSPPIENPVYENATSKDDGSIFKLNLGYEIDESLLLYGQISQGFRPGGTNKTIVGQVIPDGYTSDSVTNYELGMHSKWLDDDVTFNASIYHLVWDDIQVQQRTTDNLFTFLTNAGEAQIDGIELDLNWFVTDYFSLTGVLNIVDARLTEDQPPSDTRTGLSGDALPVVPDFTSSITAEYTWELGDASLLYLRGDINYRSESNNNFRDFFIDADPTSSTYGQETNTPNDRFAQMDAYTVSNLRFGYDGLDWGMSLYINNLSNKRGETFRAVDNFRPNGESHIIRPRTVGLSFYKSFE